MGNSRVIKTSFSDPEHERLVFLMQELGENTPQGLLRTLVKREYDNRQPPAYLKRSVAVPRETRAEKMRRIQKMTDTEMQIYLAPLLKEEFMPNEGDSAVIFTHEGTGVRMVSVKSPSTGMSEEIRLDFYLGKWEKEKRLP